jgi:hypothetical protein
LAIISARDIIRARVSIYRVDTKREYSIASRGSVEDKLSVRIIDTFAARRACLRACFYSLNIDFIETPGITRYRRISRGRREIQMTACAVLSTINGRNQLTGGGAVGTQFIN